MFKNQVNKFYLASFLKNQTYFVPIMVIFFQDLGLSYSEIFWIYTMGSIFSFIIEIPTGLFADIFGKRKSIILSKLFIFISFIFFGLATGFWSLILANLLYELGKSFRSGTETAFVYDYLAQTQGSPGYTRVKADQKFYARLSESIGTAVGGFLAVKLGFSAVFFIAAIPALINFLQTLSWVSIKENSEAYSLKSSLIFAGDSLRSLFKNKILITIVMNILIFTATLFAIDKFIQPYMKAVGVELAYFGLIYSGFLLIIAFLVKYISKLEDIYGGEKVMNFISFFAFVPMIILGLGYSGLLGIILFFLAIAVENVRSPIANSVFHDNVESKNRATMGSILELMKTSGKLVILPVAGYLADSYSIQAAILIFSLVILISSIVFWLPSKKTA